MILVMVPIGNGRPPCLAHVHVGSSNAAQLVLPLSLVENADVPAAVISQEKVPSYVAPIQNAPWTMLNWVPPGSVRMYVSYVGSP